ncbi:MAG: response regulator receiver [Armatimonadetes bacterium CSP1-3]|nr:MAG: response regulator receiver [Armatimonadetes bacterium CSP1-3]
MKPIRLLLADDLMLIRHGIRALLSSVEDVDIVGEVSTADDAVRLARELVPDVVLMDQDMPGDGLAATRSIKEQLPDIEIIVMTDRLDDVKALQAIDAGATGYILKDIPAANLTAALKAVCNGRAFFHPEITRKLMERLVSLSREQRTRMRLESEGLTPRELDILMELAKGSTDREIAAKFVVAEGTVKTHIRHILRKLGARNRTQAVAYVLRKGVIQ